MTMHALMFASIATLVLVVAFWVGRLSRNDEVRRLNRALAHVSDIYRVQSGWTQGYGNYYLLSVNGGRSWIALDPKTKALIGPADPALLAHNAGLEALVNHVRQHGPIGSRPITDEDIGALQAAGFTAKRRP